MLKVNEQWHLAAVSECGMLLESHHYVSPGVLASLPTASCLPASTLQGFPHHDQQVTCQIPFLTTSSACHMKIAVVCNFRRLCQILQYRYIVELVINIIYRKFTLRSGSLVQPVTQCTRALTQVHLDQWPLARQTSARRIN